MTEPKTRIRNTKQLTATQAADKIALELAFIERRVEQKRDAAEHNERTQGKARIRDIMLRVVDSERDKVARVLIALGCELNGIELVPANDAAQPADPDAIPEALREPVPPVTGRVVVDREAPKVGARRQ